MTEMVVVLLAFLILVWTFYKECATLAGRRYVASVVWVTKFRRIRVDGYRLRMDDYDVSRYRIWDLIKSDIDDTLLSFSIVLLSFML